MMYKEFIELIGGEKISCEDYQKVETVYMYHLSERSNQKSRF